MKERGAAALPLSFVSHVLEKDTRFLNPALRVITFGVDSKGVFGLDIESL